MFQSVSLKNTTLKNRFIRSATSERVSYRGYPDVDLLAQMYRELAKGNVGTIMTGFCFVSPGGQSSLTQNGMHEDGLIPFWQQIIEKAQLKDNNTRIFVQLVHSGRQVFFPTENPHLVPSKMPIPLPENQYRVMNKKDIKQVRKDFIEAVHRAVVIGFDGVQIHCAHGYLINQFLSPALNTRSDEYGGSTTNRSRLLREILLEIREQYTALPLAVKINACDFIENGLQPQETSEIISLVKEYILDFHEVSGWVWQGDESQAPSRKVDPKVPDEEGYYYRETLHLQKDHPEEYFALCGGIRSMNFCKRAIQDFKLLSMSRPFISEPDLVRLFQKAKNSRVRCISCNLCVTQGPDKGLECVYFNKRRANL